MEEEEEAAALALTTDMAQPSREDLTYGYVELEYVMRYPEALQRAWVGTVDFYTASRGNMDKFHTCLDGLDYKDAMDNHHKLTGLLRILMTKRREEEKKAPVTAKHTAKMAKNYLNLLFFRKYGEAFDPSDLSNHKPRAPNYRKRAPRRKGECTTHSGSCFMNPDCAFWFNQLQCGKNCPKN